MSDKVNPQPEDHPAKKASNEVAPDASPRDADAIDRYLDGPLHDDQRRGIESDPALRAELEAQRQTDEALRRVFAPPTTQAIDRAVAQALSSDPNAMKVDARGAGDKASEPRWHRLFVTPIRGGRWAVAAGLLLVLGVVVALAWQALRPAVPSWPTGYAQVVRGDMVSVYNKLVAGGFEPAWECPPPLFRLTLAGRFGQAVEMGAFPNHVEPLGLAYADSLSARTIVLMGRIQGEPAVVFIDRAEHAPDPAALSAIAANTTLVAHRKVVGEVVLIELSPFDQAQMLPAIALPSTD